MGVMEHKQVQYYLKTILIKFLIIIDIIQIDIIQMPAILLNYPLYNNECDKKVHFPWNCPFFTELSYCQPKETDCTSGKCRWNTSVRISDYNKSHAYQGAWLYGVVLLPQRCVVSGQMG